jgi:hypothetical protein
MLTYPVKRMGSCGLFKEIEVASVDIFAIYFKVYQGNCAQYNASCGCCKISREIIYQKTK